MGDRDGMNFYFGDRDKIVKPIMFIIEKKYHIFSL